MNQKKIISFMSIHFLFLSDEILANDVEKIDLDITNIMTFQPNMDLEDDKAIFNANAVSLHPRTTHLDLMLFSFSFCFGYTIDFLTTQNLFQGGPFGFKIIDPIEGTGFLHLKNGKSYLFEANETIHPAIWHGVCISKVPINEGQGSNIRLFHDKKKVLDLEFPDEPYNTILVEFYQIIFGIGSMLLRSTVVEDCVFGGTISYICLTPRALLTEEILKFTSTCQPIIQCNLMNMDKINFIYYSKNSSVRVMKQYSVKVCSQYRIAKIHINKYENQDRANKVCKLIKGFITRPPLGSSKNLFWTSLRKHNLSMLEGDIDINTITWELGQPNGGMEQACIVYVSSKNIYHDMECNQKMEFYCEVVKFGYFVLRGVCDDNLEIESYYYLNGDKKLENMIFNGFKNNIIDYKNNTWRITSISNPNKILAFYNGTKYFPVGLNNWYVTGNCRGEFKTESKTSLKLSKCDENKEFTCNDGDCISIGRICDNFQDCEDESDEKYCSNIEMINYKKEFAPSQQDNYEKLPIQINFSLHSIRTMQELENIFTILFRVQLEWEDPRLNFMRLKSNKPSILTEKEKTEIWIPMVIFLNVAGNISSILVDRFARVTIQKKYLSVGKLSPKSRIYETFNFNGNEARIQYSRHFEFPLHCNFMFEFYPFDTQICKIEVALFSRVQKKAMLTLMNGENSIINDLDSTNHLQFYIAEMFTKVETVSRKKKVVVYIVFKRLLTNILVTTYLPTFFLQIVSLITLFTSEEKFETTVMVTLTSTLVMYTLYQSVSTSLPKTAYNKMIDYWLFFSLIMPFFVFVLEILIELMNQSLKTNPTSFKKSLKAFLINRGKLIIVATTIIFDAYYWIHNISKYQNFTYK